MLGGRRSTREIAMQTAQELRSHVEECSRMTRATQASIVDLASALAASQKERRDQYDKINGNIIKMLVSIIGAVLFEIAKTKGLL